MVKCILCGKNFSSIKEFHSHVSRQEKVRLEEFYPLYYPRQDLYDGEAIVFKGDRDVYLSSIFRNRINLVKYCRKFPEKAKDVIKEVIRLRSELKGLDRMLSTVEARSVIYPTPALLENLSLDWCGIGKELGLYCKFNYKQTLSFDNKRLKLIQDSRESNPLSFVDCDVIVNKLDWGDYCSTSHFSHFAVERKSLQDYIGTHSAGFDRFKKEVVRAKNFNGYLVVLVEKDFNDFLNFQTLPECSRIKATPEFISSRMRDILNSFDNITYLFVKNRAEASRVLPKLFLMKNDIRTVDLQHEYDSKRL